MKNIWGALDIRVRLLQLHLEFDSNEWWLMGVYRPNSPRLRKVLCDEVAGLFSQGSPNWQEERFSNVDMRNFNYHEANELTYFSIYS
ncbi:hypothetical protein CsSME_00031262 [Camellia sinensis var. sinensis]